MPARRQSAASPRPCGDPRRGRGWLPAPPGSRPRGRHPASARPALAVVGRPLAAAPGAGGRSSGRGPGPGRPRPSRRACRWRVGSSGPSLPPLTGRRAASLQGGDQGGDLLGRQVALDQGFAELGLEPPGRQLPAGAGPGRQGRLTRSHEGVTPIGQGRGRDAQRARDRLQVLAAQQPQQPQHPPRACAAGTSARPARGRPRPSPSSLPSSSTLPAEVIRLYRRAYEVTFLIHAWPQRERTRPGSATSRFQAAQQASTMAR